MLNCFCRGKRVAYSVFGQITSLNGEPEDGMTVVAAGTGNCSIYSEESTLELNGNFRIRGLQPYCSYVVRLERNPDNKTPIERIIPSLITVTVRKNIFKKVKFFVQKFLTSAT